MRDIAIKLTFRTTGLKINTDSPRLHEIIESSINGTDRPAANRRTH